MVHGNKQHMAPSMQALVHISNDTESDHNLNIGEKPSINNNLTQHLDNYLIASSVISHEGQHVRAKECNAAKRNSQLQFKFNTVISTLLLLHLRK